MSWTLHQLFPVCPVPHCPKFGTRHMLPHQEDVCAQVLNGDENYIFWQGGVGSAKTITWGALAAALMIMIPGGRYILCRKDYALLFDTLWRYFRNSIEAACQQGIIRADYAKLWSVKKQGEHTLCQLPNGSWARAVQLKNVSEAMGPSYDGVFISDAMENENFGFIFHGEGTVGGLQSRLRGQASSFYRLRDGTVRDMRRFLVESNPPPNINELHAIFGKEPGVRHLPGTSVTYRHIQTSTVQNDHNPGTYIAEIASQHSDPADIRRILEGKTVPYYGGVRVISTFHPEIHVSSFDTDPDLPLFVGIDPGTQHPGVVFAQIKRCGFDQEHCIALSEISNVYDKSTHQLAELRDGAVLGILAHLGVMYPAFFDYESYLELREALVASGKRFDYTLLERQFSNVAFCIDRSGEKVYSTSKDRETDRSILLTQYGIRCRYRTNIGLNLSLDRVRDSFQELCSCGIPRLLIDRNCELLIDAYAGGFRFAKSKDGSHSDKPVRDFRYEDVADAHRYLLENFFFQAALEVSEQAPYRVIEELPWQWMEEGQRF